MRQVLYRMKYSKRFEFLKTSVRNKLRIANDNSEKIMIFWLA
jgi:hypothetical protein